MRTMANEDGNSKSSSSASSNLKVPPLKIVLSSYQNNTVANISSSSSSIDEDNKSKSVEDGDNVNEHQAIIKGEDNHTSRRNGGSDDVGDGPQEGRQHATGRKNSKNFNSERNDASLSAEIAQATSGRTATASYSSSSSSSSTCSDSSDVSTSTTPSSESLASNSTIIAENQQSAKQQKSNAEIKEETTPASGVRQERVSRYSFKVSSSERSANNTSSGAGGSKRTASHDNNTEQSTEGSQNAKEQSLNANQRITRSSQRAAQQNKTENSNEIHNDDSIAADNQSDKVHESARKAKRRKGEPQECEQDSAQTAAQLSLTMANIFPADYQLPAQNSFELYRDIRKRPYKKLMKLSHAQPKVPHGFKDYLLNAGPYLLDGNKLGVGVIGSKFENLNMNQSKSGPYSGLCARMPLKMKLSNLHQKMSHYQPSHQRHSSYKIPKLSDAPKSLQIGSPLYDLFTDQEKARHQMRMQHLKERERSILAAEQEILRAYNRAAIADKKQKLHLSACTYFYYQERYHYIDEKSDSNGSIKSKEIPHNQDNSFLCIEGGEATKPTDSNATSPAQRKELTTNAPEDGSIAAKEEEAKNNSATGQQIKADSKEDLVKNGTSQSDGSAATAKSKSEEVTKESVRADDDDPSAHVSDEDRTKEISSDEDPAKAMSDEDLRVINKELFLSQLQEIDDKWDKIKRDMLVRHKNEADSLLAVQTLEWEWKAKEIGAHDVRVPLKIELELVPRVEVAALDY